MSNSKELYVQSDRAYWQNVIAAELARAEEIHPGWTHDAVHASAILNEEAGELTQACLDFHHDCGGADKEWMREEAVQVGAMALRFLVNLEGYRTAAQIEKSRERV